MADRVPEVIHVEVREVQEKVVVEVHEKIVEVPVDKYIERVCWRIVCHRNTIINVKRQGCNYGPAAHNRRGGGLSWPRSLPFHAQKGWGCVGG